MNTTNASQRIAANASWTYDIGGLILASEAPSGSMAATFQPTVGLPRIVTASTIEEAIGRLLQRDLMIILMTAVEHQMELQAGFLLDETPNDIERMPESLTWPSPAAAHPGHTGDLIQSLEHPKISAFTVWLSSQPDLVVVEDTEALAIGLLWCRYANAILSAAIDHHKEMGGMIGEKAAWFLIHLPEDGEKGTKWDPKVAYVLAAQGYIYLTDGYATLTKKGEKASRMIKG